MPLRPRRPPIVDAAQAARIDALFARMEVLAERRKAGGDAALDAEIEQAAHELEAASRHVRDQAFAYRDAMRRRTWQVVAVGLLAFVAVVLMVVLRR
jgi:t-SNARE complex subunit (syntaxin)